MRKLILIDGNAILYRAYHALPPLSKDGVVVNAVYGFFAMFLKILEEQKPEYVVVCFDRAAPTFRQTLFAGYHENRPKMPDDLIIQVGIVHTVLQKLNATVFEVDGYEADDLIGTLAHQAAEINTNTTNFQYPISNKERKVKKDIGSLEIRNLKLEIIIVTGDRDMLQLVNSHVQILMPITGISKMVLFGEKEVEEKYGVKASQFIDYKALIGDASDNYPGVAGIGPKTAAALLQEHKSFENLYKDIAKLPEKIAMRLANDAEQAVLAKKLATIVTDAPITLEIEQTNVSHFDFKAVQEEFERLGIKSLQKRLPGYEEEKEVEKPVKAAQAKTKKDSGQLGLL